MSISVRMRELVNTVKKPKRQKVGEFGCLWSATQTEPGHLGPNTRKLYL